jgi:hypothetical protein
VVVEDGQQHVEMREGVVDRDVGLEVEGDIAAVAPLWKVRIEGECLSRDAIAERFEELGEEILVSPGAEDGYGDFEGQRPGDEFRALLAGAGEGGAEDAADGHGEEGGRDVGAVVHIVFELLGASDELDGIQLQEEAGGAAMGLGVGVEDVGLAEGEIGRMQIRRIFVEEKAEICG